jgi:23S rRNA pseudouridine1911/1915/1917 synthase
MQSVRQGGVKVDAGMPCQSAFSGGGPRLGERDVTRGCRKTCTGTVFRYRIDASARPVDSASMDPLRTVNRGHVYRDRVAAADAGRSVLEYHALHFAHSDENVWRRAIEDGLVLVNGSVAAATTALGPGDELEFHRRPWQEPEAPLEFAVVHEDEHVLAVVKPAGLQVLPAGPFLERTLLHLVQASDPSRRESAPVHRLGRGTSGIVLFGKTSEARASLSAQFRDCTPRKTYFAIVAGCSLPDSFVARQPIGSIAHGPMRIWVAKESGKVSATRVRVLRRDAQRNCTLVAAQPITGRPDQIRIHLAASGAPLVGDPLFGVGGVAISDARPGEGGYRLHATALRFTHPLSLRTVRVRSMPPWALDDVCRSAAE